MFFSLKLGIICEHLSTKLENFQAFYIHFYLGPTLVLLH